MNRRTMTAIEARRKAIQAQIDATRSAAERNRFGQFATPNLLAVEIAHFVESLLVDRTGSIQFADPSVGTGSFFSAALQAFGRERLRSAAGVELDPTFADAANDLWKTSGLEVVTGDFTTLIAQGALPVSPNLVLANPPYVRHHHLSRDEKSRLQHLARRMTGVQVNGLAGLYVYFLLLATAWMQDDGYAAWLIPSEFMDVNYGASLKRFLLDQVTLIRVHRFDPDDVQFEDALVSSAVVVFKKTPPPMGHEVEFSFGGTLSAPFACESISARSLATARKWTAYPDHPKNDRRTADHDGTSILSDLFRIQRGIATGSNKFFILEYDEAKQRGFPSNFVRPILPSPRFLASTEICGDESGYPLIDRRLCIIDCDLPERAVERDYPELWEYLKSAEELGVRDGYLVRRRTPWYKQEQREPCPFLCTYMGRGASDKQPFRFIWNRSQAIATNLYLMLYPVNRLAKMLARRPDRAKDVFELLRQVTGNELRGEGRVYGGGLNKIEPSELGRISAIPFVEKWPELLGETAIQKKLFD